MYDTPNDVIAKNANDKKDTVLKTQYSLCSKKIIYFALVHFSPFNVQLDGFGMQGGGAGQVGVKRGEWGRRWCDDV
jgi:hypothetical protein